MAEPPSLSSEPETTGPAPVDPSVASLAGITAEPEAALADWSRALPPSVTRDDAFALIGAILIHVVAAHALMDRPAYLRLGALGLDSEAIAVDVIDDAVLLRSQASNTKSDAARESVASERPGQDVSVDAAPSAAGAARPGEEADKQKAQSEVESQVADRKEDNATDAAAPEPQKAAVADGAAPGAQASAMPATDGGITIASRMAGAAEEGRTAAAEGERQRYASEVMRRLASNMPRPAGNAIGVVRVNFLIDAEGRVSDARVARSSGDARLDQLVLSTVRSTTFSAPPPSMREGERRYEIPYIFR